MAFISTQEKLSWTKPMLWPHQFPMNSNLGAVIKRARLQKRKVQREVAAALGVSVAAVGQWERGDNEITTSNLRKLADFLGIDYLAANRGELVFSEEAAQDITEIQKIGEGASTSLRGPRDVPVLGASYGSADADFEMNGTVVDYVRRPEGIATARDIFALHVLGDSMSPKFEPGDLVYCGGRTPVPGDDVVVEMNPEATGEAGKGFIKRLVGRQGGKIICRQFNPPVEVAFTLSDVRAIHRVIPYKELLGF